MCRHLLSTFLVQRTSALFLCSEGTRNRLYAGSHPLTQCNINVGENKQTNKKKTYHHSGHILSNEPKSLAFGYARSLKGRDGIQDVLLCPRTTGLEDSYHPPAFAVDRKMGWGFCSDGKMFAWCPKFWCGSGTLLLHQENQIFTIILAD